MQYGNIIPTIYPTGVFIQSIEQTKTSNESGGENVFTATLTNHTQHHFVVKNGKTGTGATVEAAGLFGFYIDGNTGDLMLSYSGNVAPNLTLNANGELIYTF
ncbi:hypothetical protein [Treponema sp.]|uniref:hypothetical protein n=1 Tax=Treponema sp. TaxID=166 RepID=UPI003FA2BA7E